MNFPVNGGASLRWSFGPHSAWGSIELTIILTTHPCLIRPEIPDDAVIEVQAAEDVGFLRRPDHKLLMSDNLNFLTFADFYL